MVMGDFVQEVDVVVVGGGPGGYSAAFRCADLGLETVVVDAGARLGGACLFEGCIPSKALLHAARLVEDAAHARELGIEFGEPRISLDPLRKWKSERVIGKLARGLASVARGKKVEVVAGRAVLEGSRELRVEGETPRKIRFGHAILATGSVPRALPGAEALGARVMDSTAALELPDVPERLLVPFDAISTFFDPSVQFGLKFEAQDQAEDAASPEVEPAEPAPAPAKLVPAALPAAKGKLPAAEPAPASAKDEPAAEGEDSRGSAEVVSLDSFRKKP